VAARRREPAAELAKPVIRPVGKGAEPKAMPAEPAGRKTMVAKAAAPKESTIAGAAAGAARAVVAAAKKAAGKP
jgi:hypothetical protein